MPKIMLAQSANACSQTGYSYVRFTCPSESVHVGISSMQLKLMDNFLHQKQWMETMTKFLQQQKQLLEEQSTNKYILVTAIL